MASSSTLSKLLPRKPLLPFLLRRLAPLIRHPPPPLLHPLPPPPPAITPPILHLAGKPFFPFSLPHHPAADLVDPPEDDDGESSGKVWADSVKRKRKKKMNKHKYKKRRKLMRKKT